MVMKSLKMKLGVLIRNYPQLHIITSTRQYEAFESIAGQWQPHGSCGEE